MNKGNLASGPLEPVMAASGDFIGVFIGPYANEMEPYSGLALSDQEASLPPEVSPAMDVLLCEDLREAARLEPPSHGDPDKVVNGVLS